MDGRCELCKRCKQLFTPRGTHGQFDYYFCPECVEHAISNWHEVVDICSRVMEMPA